MACDARIVGTAVVVTFTPDGGSAHTMSADFTTFSFDRSVDTVDATAGNETERCHKATIENMEFSITLYDAAQSFKSDLLPGTVGVWNVKPEGAGSGLEEFEFNGLLTGYSEEYPFDNLLEIELSGLRNGAMVKEFGTLQA